MNHAPQKGAVIIWETIEGTPLGPPLYHQAPARSVDFDIDATQILSSSEDRTARLWKLDPLSYNVADAIRIFSLLSQSDEDSAGRTVAMRVDKESIEHVVLSRMYPELFTSTNRETEHWTRQFEILQNEE